MPISHRFESSPSHANQGNSKGYLRLLLAVIVFSVTLYLGNRSSALLKLTSSFDIDRFRNISTNESSSSTNWWDDYVDQVATPFARWKGPKYSWCIEEASNDTTFDGLMLAKTFKTGSSSAAALTLHISHRVAQRHLKQHHCKAFFKHSFMTRNRHSHRVQPSLLWTIVRNPANRAVSAINFFQVGMHGNNLSEEEMVSLLSEEKNVQLHQIRISQGEKSKLGSEALESFDNLTTFIKESVFAAYDFVAVSERWDESVAVMQLLFDLQAEDMIILPAKKSGSWTWDRKHGDEAGCFLIPRPQTPKPVEKYLRTEFTHRNADFLLHAAAHKSLDLTIDLLGRDLVAAQVAKLKTLQEYVQRQCLHEAVFPCSSNGTFQRESQQDCYWLDMGCGYRCIDRVVASYKMGLNYT